jgi:hypothetical protein
VVYKGAQSWWLDVKSPNQFAPGPALASGVTVLRKKDGTTHEYSWPAALQLGPSLRVFLCYRRDDTRWVAGRLYDRLHHRHDVFQDITAIRPGFRYTDQIQEEISRCDVLLVVMDEGWLSAADPQGRRRLDSPRDLVRLEIAAALQRGIPIIPVLVQRASIPADVDLPDDIADLTLYHACEVTDTRWDYDIGLLLKAINGFAGSSVSAETSG